MNGPKIEIKPEKRRNWRHYTKESTTNVKLLIFDWNIEIDDVQEY